MEKQKVEVCIEHFKINIILTQKYVYFHCNSPPSSATHAVSEDKLSLLKTKQLLAGCHALQVKD